MTVTYLGVAEANAWLQEKLVARPVWMGLHIAEPTRLADPASELLGGGYVRKRILFSAPSSGTVANTNNIIFSGLPACIVLWISVWSRLLGDPMVIAQSLPGSGVSVPENGQYLVAPNDIAFAA